MLLGFPVWLWLVVLLLQPPTCLYHQTTHNFKNFYITYDTFQNMRTFPHSYIFIKEITVTYIIYLWSLWRRNEENQIEQTCALWYLSCPYPLLSSWTKLKASSLSQDFYLCHGCLACITVSTLKRNSWNNSL